MTIGENTEKLSVVPEVFYDLISRVPVGIIILLTAYLLLPDCQLPLALKNIPSSTIAAVVVPIAGFVLSYVIGLALSSISGFVLFPVLDGCYWKWIKSGFADLSKLPGANAFYEASNLKWTDRLKARMRVHIFLKRKDPRVGLEMAKHQAESSLFANLTVGLGMLILVFLYSDHVGKTVSPPCNALDLRAYGTVSALCGASAVVAYLRNQGYWRYHFRYAESFLKT